MSISPYLTTKVSGAILGLHSQPLETPGSHSPHTQVSFGGFFISVLADLRRE